MAIGAWIYGSALSQEGAGNVGTLLGVNKPCVHPHLLRSAGLGVAIVGALNVMMFAQPNFVWSVLIVLIDIAGFAHYFHSAFLVSLDNQCC
jgi:hypothetical protein